MTAVVLDCDTRNEVDDQFAIAHLLGAEGLDVRGVVSVHDTFAHGPGSRDLYQAEAERIVGLCGRSADVPCVPGAARPMEHRGDVVRSPGLDFLVELARAAPLTLVATGPATDVAALVAVAPEVLETLRVVWLGGFGSAAEWELRKYAELNGRADVAAWRELVEAPLDLVLVPGWTATTKLRVEVTPFAGRLRATGAAVGHALADLLVEWDASSSGRVEAERGTKVLWDVACSAAVADPAAVTLEQRPLPRLDAAAAHDYARSPRSVPHLVDLDADRVLDGLLAAIARAPGGRGELPEANETRGS